MVTQSHCRDRKTVAGVGWGAPGESSPSELRAPCSTSVPRPLRGRDVAVCLSPRAEHRGPLGLCWPHKGTAHGGVDSNLRAGLLPSFLPRRAARAEGTLGRELTEFAVFAFVAFQAGARVLAEAVFAAALVLARAALALVTICRDGVCEPELAGSSHGHGNGFAVLILARAVRMA